LGSASFGQAFSFFGKCLIFGGFFRSSRTKKALDNKSTRLRATEMAVDPTAKQRTVQGNASAYTGTKKYGEPANLPVSAMKMKKKGVSLGPFPGALPPRKSAFRIGHEMAKTKRVRF
jgi:hypothetical protein